MRGALNLNAKKLALFRQFSTGLFGTKNTNGWLHMCRRPSVLKQGARSARDHIPMHVYTKDLSQEAKSMSV